MQTIEQAIAERDAAIALAERMEAKGDRETGAYWREAERATNRVIRLLEERRAHMSEAEIAAADHQTAAQFLRNLSSSETITTAETCEEYEGR